MIDLLLWKGKMANDNWMTPPWVYKPLGPFDLDAAATRENTIAPRFITAEDDAFTCDWTKFAPHGSSVWCNPPYSKEAGPLSSWIDLFVSWAEFYDIIALLPADTSTKWFHKVWDNDQEGFMCRRGIFLERRVRHIDPITGKPGGSPKFGSLLLWFSRF